MRTTRHERLNSRVMLESFFVFRISCLNREPVKSREVDWSVRCVMLDPLLFFTFVFETLVWNQFQSSANVGTCWATANRVARNQLMREPFVARSCVMKTSNTLAALMQTASFGSKISSSCHARGKNRRMMTIGSWADVSHFFEVHFEWMNVMKLNLTFYRVVSPS